MYSADNGYGDGNGYENGYGAGNDYTSGFGQGNGYEGANYSNGFGEGNGYGYDNALSITDSAFGAGDTAFNTDFVTNPYAENPYQVNVFDNAYTESLSNPNPTSDYSTGFELE